MLQRFLSRAYRRPASGDEVERFATIDELVRLAAEGELDDAAALDQQVRRLLEDARARDFAASFTTQRLG